MPITEPLQYHQGMLINPDAVDIRSRKYLSKMLKDVLKTAGDKVTVTDLFRPNVLTREQGTSGKLWNLSQYTAKRKDDATPTKVQKIISGEVEYELYQYEVKVAITDKAKLNSQMTAQGLLTAGQAGRAFARRLDADGYNEMQTGNVVTAAATAAWDVATDAQIEADINAATDRLDDAGFHDHVVIMTKAQKSRISVIARGIGAGITFKTYMDEELGLSTFRMITRIREMLPDGTWNTLFNPFDHFIVMDKDAWGVFSQLKTTMEYMRDVPAGVDFAFIRKWWGFQGIQANACQVISGVNL